MVRLTTPLTNDQSADAFRVGSLRLLLLLLLLGTQLLAISLSFDAMALSQTSLAGTWLGALMYAGQLSRFLSVFGVVLLIIVWPRHQVYLQALSETGERRRQWYLFALQAALFGGFFFLTSLLFSASSYVPDPLRVWLLPLWMGGGLGVFGAWCLALGPLTFWRGFLGRERWSFVLAAVAALLAWGVARYSQHLWEGLAGITLYFAHGLLTLFFNHVSIDTESKLLGVDDFLVIIGIPCSGYEGIGMISVFVGLYLSLFRADFRFPHALLLFPIGIASIWLFNLIRVVALVAIGARVSPELALGGFHSQAGWISFLLVSVGLLYVAHSSGLLAREPSSKQFSGAMLASLPIATLLPLLTLLLVALLSAVISSGFDWQYPLKIIAGAVMLALCWPVLRLTPVAVRWSLWLQPVMVGGVVFALWLLLVPLDGERSQAAQDALQAAAPWAALLWLAFRVLGSVVVVPIVEELAFRGYLLCRLGREEVTLHGPLRFSWVALLGSSLLFGMLHGDWLAGLVAGLAYGALRYRSPSIHGPIVAHAVTNLLIVVYVVSTGNLSLW